MCFYIYLIAIFWWARKLSVGITAVWKVTLCVEWTHDAFLLKINLMDVFWATLDNVYYPIVFEPFFSFGCPDTMLFGSHLTSLTFLLSLFPLSLFFAQLLNIGVLHFLFNALFICTVFLPHSPFLSSFSMRNSQIFLLFKISKLQIQLSSCPFYLEFPWAPQPRHVWNWTHDIFPK